MLAVFLWGVAIYGAVIKDRAGAMSLSFLALFTTLVATRTYRRLNALTREHHEFLRRLEGKPVDEAVAMARGESLGLPPGLVAHKVGIPFPRWRAFERGAF